MPVDFVATPGVPSYSMRAVRAFLAVLRKDAQFAGPIPKTLEALDADARVAMRYVHRLLEQAERAGAAPTLGLEASMDLDLGDLGAVDYAWSSAADVEQALEVAAHYAALVNDTMACAHEVVDGRVFVRLSNPLSLPRSAAEFQLGAVLLVRKRVWPADLWHDLDVWLTSSQPVDVSEYRRAFAPGRVHFGAPFSGFSFDARHLSAPLQTTDAKLHDVMRKHMELVLSSSPQLQGYVPRVRALLNRLLPKGTARTADIARLLHTSPSTLRRRLEAEGTSFSALREEQRRRLALEHLASRQLSMPELALLTGFSQPSAFHRAFRRWTGKTPLQYRRERRTLRARLAAQAPPITARKGRARELKRAVVA